MDRTTRNTSRLVSKGGTVARKLVLEAAYREMPTLANTDWLVEHAVPFTGNVGRSGNVYPHASAKFRTTNISFKW